MWCHFDRPGLLGGVEHISGLLEWHPSYLPDAAVLGWLRHVFYPDGGEETPVAVLQIDNPDQPGEIGMSADDLAAVADCLLALRENLLD